VLLGLPQLTPLKRVKLTWVRWNDMEISMQFFFFYNKYDIVLYRICEIKNLLKQTRIGIIFMVLGAVMLVIPLIVIITENNNKKYNLNYE
jgi:hypothetical protein